RHQRLDDTDAGYKLQIGAYFTPRFAMEFGYRNYGKFDFEIGATGESGDVETWATTLAGILSVSLTSNLYLTPRLGVASLRFEQRSEEHTSELHSRERIVCSLRL